MNGKSKNFVITPIFFLIHSRNEQIVCQSGSISRSSARFKATLLCLVCPVEMIADELGAICLSPIW